MPDYSEEISFHRRGGFLTAAFCLNLLFNLMLLCCRQVVLGIIAEDVDYEYCKLIILFAFRKSNPKIFRL